MSRTYYRLNLSSPITTTRLHPCLYPTRSHVQTLTPRLTPSQQIIATRPKGSRGRGGRRGGSAPRPTPTSTRPQGQQQQRQSGARAKYAGNLPGSGRAGQTGPGQVNPLAHQKQATSEALKVIISNLPLDVEEESVRVSLSFDPPHESEFEPDMTNGPNDASAPLQHPG